MSSAKRDVDVHDGNRRVERLADRPIRLMPDQRAGVVYGGEVYPLHTGDRIDLTDTPVKKTLCGRFVAPSAPVPYAAEKHKATGRKTSTPAVDRWYVESNRFGHYLVFDAPAATAKHVVALMDKAGLGVRRWDESVRESDNGELYDWFIRLEFDGSRDECLQRIRTVLQDVAAAAPGSGPAITAGSAELRQLRVEVLELRTQNLSQQTDALLAKLNADQQITRLTANVNLATQTSAKMQRQLTQLRGKHRTERDDLRRQVSDLERQLAAARATTTSGSARNQRLQEVLDAKAETEQHYFEAQAAAESATDRAQLLEGEAHTLRIQLDAANAEVKLLREELEETRAELAETRTEARERRTATRALGGPPQGSVEAFLSRLLPRTDLDADSLETLLNWPHPAAAVDFLRQVDARIEPRGRKPVLNKAGWWEIPKVNTGRTGKETSGRLYYAPTKNQRVFAVLHEKEDDKEQKRFIAQLPDHP